MKPELRPGEVGPPGVSYRRFPVDLQMMNTSRIHRFTSVMAKECFHE